MKKIKFIFLLALSLVLSSLSGIASADAVQGEDDFGITLQQVDQMKRSGATDQAVITFLNSQGIEVLASDSVILDNSGNQQSEISTRAVDTSLRKLTNWITKDSGMYYAWVSVERLASLPSSATIESYPASYDVVSINWDSKKFKYVASGATNGNMWLADADQRESGTILFNMYDNVEHQNLWTVSAYAKLSAKTTGQTTTSAKYTHTFDAKSTSTSYSGQASWQWGSPLNLGVNYSVTITDKESNWTKAATANVTIN